MMHCTRNILWVVGMVAMLAGGCSRSPKVKEAEYMQKGQKEIELKHYGIAILYFKNAVQVEPRDAEPYYQLGLTYLAANDPGTAMSYLMKATELNPKHTGAQLRVAELMATSRSKEVLDEAEKRSRDVLDLLPESVDALNVLAITELRLGKPENAEAHLEEALRKAPADLRASVVLAQTKLARKDVAEAEAVLKQAVTQAPKSPEPSVYLGGFYLALGRTADAEQQFRQALKIDPKHGAALLELAAMQVRAGQAEQAEQTYRQVSALPDARYRPVHALYLFRSGKRDQAVAEFERLAKADPKDRAIRTELVSAYLATNRVGDAVRVLTATLKDNRLDVDALLQRSRIYLSSQKYAEAEADLNQVLHFRRESAQAHYLLSKVQQGRGSRAMQRQELGEALRLDPGYLAARVDLAKVLIGTGGAQSALELLNQAPSELRKAIPLLVQQNWALLALGQVAEARKGVDELLAVGKIPDALLQDAILKLNQKDNSHSRAVANEVLSRYPGDTRALNLLVQSYAIENQLPVGVQKVREFAARQPSLAPVQEYLGQLLFANGDLQGARKAFEAAKTADPSLVRVDLGLADLDTREGKLDDARKRLSALVAAHPENQEGRLLLAQAEDRDGQSAVAIEEYRKALTLGSTNFGALNNLAYLLANSRQPDEALKYAQQAKELNPASPAVDDTLGWTYYQKGMYSMAVTQLQSAVSKESTAVRQYHLAMACWKAGDANQGRRALEAALKLNPKLPEAQMARQLIGDGVR